AGDVLTEGRGDGNRAGARRVGRRRGEGHRRGDGVRAGEGDAERVAGRIEVPGGVLGDVPGDAHVDGAVGGRRDVEGVSLGIDHGETAGGAVRNRQIPDDEAGDVFAERHRDGNRARRSGAGRTRGDDRRRRNRIHDQAVG